MPQVRVVSYNIRGLRDDAAAVARVLTALEPDLACLQEAPRLLRWRWRRRGLARRTGLTRAADRRPAGIAVYSAPEVRVLGCEHHLLTRVPSLHRRGLALAVVEVSGRRLIAASTHLDLQDAPRLAHAAEVLTLLDRARHEYEAPVILTGDINEQPDGPTWRLLTKTFQDAHATAPSGAELTFSSRNPRRRIDAIFADPELEVTSCGVPDAPHLTEDYKKATDHLPVLAELVLP